MVSTQEGVVCIHNPAAGREKRLGIGTLEPAKDVKNIMVVGAGIAGMKFAEIAAKRGHKVSVYDKNSEVGGQMLMAEKIPMRAEQSEVYRYLRVQLQMLNVPVELNRNITIEDVKAINPDIVVNATGSHATLPDLDMTDKNIVLLDPRTVMQHPEKVGNNVVVIDKIGYWQAMGVADYIATLGSKISIVTDRLYVGVDIEETCRENLNRRLARKNVDSYTSFRLAEVNDKQVVLENIFDKERRITLNDVDTLVVAQDSRSDNELYKQLKNEGEYETYVLGDAAAPGTVLRIIFDAEELGRRI